MLGTIKMMFVASVCSHFINTYAIANGKSKIIRNYISKCNDYAPLMFEDIRNYMVDYERVKQWELLASDKDEIESQVGGRKVISISPGGLRGFYMMGTITYIKENYNLDNYVFSGASAGAWNALYMSCKKEPIDLALKILGDDAFVKARSINEIEHLLKYKLLSTYTHNDFSLDKVFIGITTLNRFKPTINIISNFQDLEDAINCCIASSHIPLITGGLINIYQNKYAFDGGFCSNPYVNISKPVLHITPSIWKEIIKLDNGRFERKMYKPSYKQFLYDVIECPKLLRNKNLDFFELFDQGYNDAKKNKEYLDFVFNEK